MIFPLRPLTLVKSRRSPAKRLTYWYRPHTSPTRKPVVFIHGIGIGLYPYVNFLAQLDARLNAGRSSKDQVGIIAVEIMPVSFRITHTALRRDEMCDEIQAIISHHKLDKPIIVSHSYGTVVATQLLKSPRLASSIGPVVLIDPISILLHHPDVAYNFTRREPKRANEHQLYYFASMDMGVSHSLSRCFFWSENVLWKHDIGDRPFTVSLAEKDLIVNTQAVGDYLASHNEEVAAQRKESANNVADGYVSEKLDSQHTQGSVPNGKSNGHANGGTIRARLSTTVTYTPISPRGKDCVEWRDRTWVGKGLDLIWFRTLDHAQVFDNAQSRKPLVEAIERYSARAY
jgi:pimeloyl-ACP methyl ester carboxylesterase